MDRYWKRIICPIIKLIQAKHIIEIGSDDGINTKNILEYCSKYNAFLTSIDPSPSFDVEQFKLKYRAQFTFIKSLSLDTLPALNKFDTILIDGDHNWYTVYNELKVIEENFKDKSSFPLIFIHEVGWPYARRDRYYNPNTIPKEHIQYYEKLGIDFHEETLVKEGGINSNFFNAYYCNTPKNGVLTAIEDFMCESEFEFILIKIPLFNGLGILFKKDLELENKINEIINPSNLFELIENELIETQTSLKNTEITKNNLKYEKNKLLKEKEAQTQQINQLQQENETQYRELLDVTNKDISNELIIKDIKTELRILNNEHQQLKNKLNEAKINLKTVNSQKNLLYSEKEQDNKQLQKIKVKNQKYIKDITKLETKIQLLASQKSNLLVELKKEKNKIQEISSKNQNYKNKINNLETKLQISNSQKNIILTEFNKEKNKIQDQYIENQNKINNLKSELQISTVQKNILLVELNKITKDYSDLKIEIETKNSKLSELISINNKQKEEIIKLKNNINNNNTKIEKYELSNSWKFTKPFRITSSKLKFKKN